MQLLLNRLTTNQPATRRKIATTLLDRRRDINDECGWPHEEPTAHEYKDLYDRNAIAGRVVECLPKESWQVTPWVYESSDTNVVTDFERAWDALGSSLRGKSWFKEEQGSLIWDYLMRADILSGIGQYGVILLGFDDGQTDLSQPVLPKPGMKLLYMRVFPESLAPVTSWDTNDYSPRKGMPLTYMITYNDPKDRQSGIGVTTATRTVHYTRIVHIADNLGSSEVLGMPRMRQVLNNILDCQKVTGGSAEMYWQGALPGISIETLPQLGGDVEVDVDSLRDSMELFFNGLQRYLQLTGQTAKTLAPTVVDPSPQVAIQIEQICIKLGIPVRIFKGSERGELASTQDDDAWNDRLVHRENLYLTPRVIVPVVDRLIWAGVLPEPQSDPDTGEEGGYCVEWPDLTSRSDTEKADVAVKRTSAMAQYVQSGAEQLMKPLDFLVHILDFSEEEAEAILTTLEESMQETVASPGDTSLLPTDTASPARAVPQESGTTETTATPSTTQDATQVPS
jgi:hypothetical protein